MLVLVYIQSCLPEEWEELKAVLPVTIPIKTRFSAGPRYVMTHPNTYRETYHSEL